MSYLALAAVLAGCGGGSSGSAGFGTTTTGATAANSASATPVASASGGKDASTSIQKLDSSWVKIADENQALSFASATAVQYGADDSWAQRTVTGSGSCSNAFFGRDPIPGVVKGCFVQTATTTTTSEVRLAGENQSFTVASATTVKYGAGSTWVQKSVTGTNTCGNAFFGQDPAPGVVKACFSVGGTTASAPAAVAPAVGTWLAGENQSFSVAGTITVRYGAGSSWAQKSVTGSDTCSNGSFGRDPAPGVVKACYVDGGPVLAAPTTPPATSTPVAPVTSTDPGLANNILNGSGVVDAAAYRNTAGMMGKDGGVSYRYGPSSADYGSAGNGGVPTWFKRNDTAVVSDRNGGQRPCLPEFCGTWQVGNWSNDVGDFASNVGHVAFMPDSPSQRIGVSDLIITSASNAAFTQKPELPWMFYGRGLDEVSAVDYKAAGMDTTNPVALGRCYGRPGWCLSSIMVFQNGLIGVAGSNVASNKATAQLAPGKVPTAVALSNSSEFAFITVWDTVNLRGEIAVVALAGLGEGRTAGNPSGSSWWDEWNAAYPGLPNLGNVGFMKVLGYVPLPADMKAPTEISVTTGVDRHAYLNEAGSNWERPYNLTLSSASNRNTFKAGGRNYNTYAKAGVAVVVSKSEQKVAFVDLKPLFQYYQSMYFGSDADFSATTNIGAGDSQWPRTFAAAGQQTPTVIKTMSLSSRPTAVKTLQYGGSKRAWVATQDGNLRIFNLGDYPTAGTGSAASITEGASVAVGRNPTGIAFAKEKGGNQGNVYPDIQKEVIVTSRGDRQLTWVRFAGDYNSGSVVRTLKDSRLVDPISTEDSDNHGTEHYVLSVADYGGRKLHNYRYGPIILHTYQGQNYGMGGSGNDAFEYGGAFDLPGKAFHVTSSNIP